MPRYSSPHFPFIFEMMKNSLLLTALKLGKSPPGWSKSLYTRMAVDNDDYELEFMKQFIDDTFALDISVECH